jgi:hypothetical protein
MSQLVTSEGQPRRSGGGAGSFCVGLRLRGLKRNAGRSGMTGDCHVPICGGVGVRFPCATRLATRKSSKFTPPSHHLKVISYKDIHLR